MEDFTSHERVDCLPVLLSGEGVVQLVGWCRSRVVMFTAIRLRGPGFKPRPGQKFENENFCFRRTPAVVNACHPCRVRPIKTPLYKTLYWLKPDYLSYHVVSIINNL